jgi:folate-binding protein YgfZ
MPGPDPYAVALERAIIADRSPRGIIGVKGRDRQTLLHNLLTNDIAGLRSGEGCYAAYLTPQGRLITDMRVAVLDDLVLVDVEPDVKDDLLQRFDQSIFAEDVRLEDLSELSVIRIAGPDSATLLVSLVDGFPDWRRVSVPELSALAEYSNVELMSGEKPMVIVRDDTLGVPGFDVLLARDLGDRLRAAAEAQGIVRADSETLEVLRVEAGRPRFLVDMDRDTIPLEAGIESRAISMTKGCYPGQEVIIRVLHRGHGRVARRLVGLVVEGDAVPASGDAILKGSQQVGVVTSAVMSRAVEKPIALGYVRREEAEPGRSLAVDSGSGRLEAVVISLPFRRHAS